jgi:hypothetical protein
MIRSAWKLLALETIRRAVPVEIPSRHTSDLSERISLSSGILLRSTALEAWLGALELARGSVEFEFVWPRRHLSQIVPVMSATTTEHPVNVPALSRGTRFPGRLVLLNEGAPRAVPKDPGEFRDFVQRHGSVTLEESAPVVVILRWRDERTVGFLRLAKAVQELVDVPVEECSGARTPPAVLSSAAAARVAIVGLGSMGSKVAVALARSGIRRFVLVDGDVLLGPNVCRHAATFSDVGVMKVDAVRETVREVCATEPEVARYPVALGSATNPELHARVLEEVASADVLVDATANPEAFCLLAMVASDRQRPLVWGEVYGGGLGGLVASAHPDYGPCPRCVRAGIQAEMGTWPPAPAAGSGNPYEGGEAEPLVATDADVSFVSAVVTNRVLDLLGARDPELPAAVVLGLRRGWVFEAPMTAIPVRVRKDDWCCARCWRTGAESDSAAAARAEALFRDPSHADDPPAT